MHPRMKCVLFCLASALFGILLGRFLPGGAVFALAAVFVGVLACAAYRGRL